MSSKDEQDEGIDSQDKDERQEGDENDNNNDNDNDDNNTSNNNDNDNDYNNDYDDEDADNWSRQVEMDEASLSVHHYNLVEGAAAASGSLYGSTTGATALMESVAEDVEVFGLGNHAAAAAVPHPPPPISLKQEAILRERQRRIETERARLKRQFAQQQQHGQQSAQDSNATTGTSTTLHLTTAVALPATVADSASIAETIESTMVHPDEENAQNPEMRLGFNMERFLRNSQDFEPAMAAAAETQNTSNGNDKTDKDAPPILMERFINQPVVVEPAPPSASSYLEEEQETTTNSHNINNIHDNSVQRTVSFQAATSSTHHTNNTSAHELQRQSSLTQEQQEQQQQQQQHQPNMTPSVPSATYSSFEEDATTNISIQVHPDEDDEHEHGVIGDNDQQESNNQDETTENAPRGLTEADVQAMEATEEASIANAPPSERDELLSEVGELADFGVTPTTARPDFSQGTPTTTVESSISNKGGSAASQQSQLSTTADHLPLITLTGSSSPHVSPVAARPGTPPMSNAASSAVAAVAAPNLLVEPASPLVGHDHDAYTPWSPPGEMLVSPLQQHHHVVVATSPPDNLQDNPPPPPPPPLVGDATEDGHVDVDAENGFAATHTNTSPPRRTTATTPSDHDDIPPVTEVTPLLGVPPEIITTRAVVNNDDDGDENDDNQREPAAIVTPTATTTMLIWKRLREYENSHQPQRQVASAAYAHKTAWQRAWPERGMTICVTYVWALPILIMASHVVKRGLCGASTSLQDLALWMTFLPTLLATTRHLHFQSSLVTRTAASYAHVTTGDSWTQWCTTELRTAAVLGIQGAVVWGAIALLLQDGSGDSHRLASCVALAQFATSALAGMLGVCMPFVTMAVLLYTVDLEDDDETARSSSSIGGGGGRRRLFVDDIMVALGSAWQDLAGTVVWWLVSFYFLASKRNDNVADLRENDLLADLCA